MVAQTRAQAKRMGAPRAEALCLNFGGALDFVSGDWSVAESNLRRAIELYRELGSASGESLSQQRLGVLLTAMGRVDEAWEILTEGVAVAERATMRSHCLTRMYASMARNRLAAEDIQAAVQCLEDGAEVAASHGACVTCSALLSPEAVRVAVAAGDLELAEQHTADLEALAEEYQSQAWRGMATQARGRLLAAQGRLDEAVQSLLLAESTYRDAGAPYEMARSQLARAQAIIALGEVELGRELAEAAQAVMTRIGASGLES